MKIQDKYYREIERLLYNYNMLKINIEIADKQLEELREEDGLTGIDYNGIQTSETYKITSQTEDAAVRNITAEELIIKRKEKLQNKLEMLDMLLDGLNDTERKIIELFYMEGKQWWQIAYEVKYSESHSRAIRREAIKKLALGMFGEQAIVK